MEANMRKAILEFSLPEEARELEDALDGGKWRSILQSIEQGLKYGDERDIKFRELINDAVFEYGLSLFD